MGSEQSDLKVFRFTGVDSLRSQSSEPGGDPIKGAILGYGPLDHIPGGKHPRPYVMMQDRLGSPRRYSNNLFNCEGPTINIDMHTPEAISGPSPFLSMRRAKNGYPY